MKRLFGMILTLAMLVGMVLPYLPLRSSAAKIENYKTAKDYSGLKLSVIGDSISTYYGVSNNSTYNPLFLTTSEATFGTYYGNPSHDDYSETKSVTRSETWWQQIVDTLGMELLVNNAWSGSFCLIDQGQSNTTEYPAAAYKNRCVNLHNGNDKPDIIGVYLGTNDIAYYSSGVTVGTKANVDTTSERSALYTSVNNYKTPSTSIEAYYIMLSRMVDTYPDAEIYCMLPTICMNTMGSGRLAALNDFNAGVTYLVEHFSSLGKKVYLVDLNSNSGIVDNTTVRNYYYCNNVHPSCAGMDMITTCFISEMIEHSQKGTALDTAYPVEYQLSEAFPKAGLAKWAVEGQSFKVDFLPYTSGDSVNISVTMGGEDVTDIAVSGESVNISRVTGPVIISATCDAVAAVETGTNYSWTATTSGWVSDFGYGLSYNNPSKYTGTYSATTGSDGVVDGNFSTVQYDLSKTVTLQYTKPWVIEFEADGTGTTGFAGGIFLMSKTRAAKVSGNTYLYLDQTSLNLGYSDGSNYIHAGVEWGTMASAMGLSVGKDIRNDSHIYRLVNVPNGTSNKIYLYVDGINVGTMDQYVKNSASLSGRNFYFNYQGATNFELNSCTMSYLKVWENGESTISKDVFNNYRWEPSASGDAFINITGDGFDANGATELTGSVSGGTLTSSTFKLEKQVVLLHDKLWSIEWEMEGQWSGGGLILSNDRQSNTTNNVYLFRSNVIALGCRIDSQYNNYGIIPSEYGINRADRHVYRLDNRLFDDGSNMVYLYVDDVELGPLNMLYVNGSTPGTQDNWLNGQDFAFSYMGTENHPINDTKLYYFQVSEGCCHDEIVWDVAQDATCTQEGKREGTCSVCGKVISDTIPAKGHSYACTVRGATCNTYATYDFTCTVCGDSYSLSAGEMAATWMDELPAGMDKALFESKTQYRYCDSGTVTSYEPSMEGYTLKSSEWVKSGSGSVQFVSSWPAGFSTSSSLYTKYNNSASKVTASETETTKTVVDSNEVVGYLYYHWCYTKSVNSKWYKTGSYTTFHAYYSTTAPSNYTYDVSDASYKTSMTSCCTNSNWYFVADVYQQNYTTYNKLFTYERLSEMSDWSDTPVAEAEGRTVQTRTVYRLKEAALASHAYDNGVITTAPGCTTAGVKTYTCSVCGDSYTQSVAATGHNYTVSVTQPTCTTGGFTTHTCSGCGNSYVDSATAATGHSYVNGVCSSCNAADPDYAVDYYLIGYINGANYGCEDDWANLGQYKFVNGTLVATFDVDSYVFVKESNNTKWYMTYSYVNDTSATLYSTDLGATEKMFVPGGVELTFTLVQNEDGSMTLSYTMAEDDIVVPNLTLSYPSLSFEDEILYNVYYTLDDATDIEEMGLITFASRLENGTIADAVDVIPGYVNSGSTYMVQSHGVPAKNLSDAVYFKVYAKLTDGSYVYTEIAGYHAVAYANTVLNNAGSSAKAKALVVAMLNYGAAAQEYFGYKAETPMNAALTAEQQALVQDYESGMVQEVVKADSSKVGSFVMNGGYSNIFPTVSFEGAFSINYYFTPNKVVDSAPVMYYWDAATYDSVTTLTVDNATGVITMSQDGSNWGAAVEGIAAKSIDETIYVAGIYTSNGVSYPTGIISYSLGKYCQTIAANGEAFGAATAVYGFYAKAYFA